MRNKRVIKVPAAHVGQGVRWTLEVSADLSEHAAPAPRATGKTMSVKHDKASRKAARRKASRQAVEATDANTFREAVHAMPLADHSVPAASDHRAFQRRFDQDAADQGELQHAPVPAPLATAPAMDAEDVEIIFEDAPALEAFALEATPIEVAPTGATGIDTPAIEALALEAMVIEEPAVEMSPAVEPASAAPVTAAPETTAPPTPQPVVVKAVPPRPQWTMTRRAKMMAVAAGCALMIGALTLGRDPASGASVAVSAAPASPVSSMETATLQPEATPVVQPDRIAALEAPQAVQAPAPKTPAPKPIAEKPTVARETRLATVSAAPAPVTAVAPAPPPVTAEPAANAAVTAAPATTLAEGPAPVTITGCLEGTTGGDQFRLTDTDGDAAPKARGWRSGFLKKKPAAVALTASDVSPLKKYIGYRVTATGILSSREMRVRSFQPTGAMCE